MGVGLVKQPCPAERENWHPCQRAQSLDYSRPGDTDRDYLGFLIHTGHGVAYDYESLAMASRGEMFSRR
jgi:hypothetical protein